MMKPDSVSLRQELRQDWQRLVARLRELLAGKSERAAEPAAAMFAHIQRRLLLWYAGVLAAILLLSGIVLYAAMQQLLLGQIDSSLAHTVQSVLYQDDGACDLPDFARAGIP